MSRARRQLDEDDVRVRPGRSKSRPRSKDRPTFDDAVIAMVTAVDRGRFTLDVDGTSVYAVKARELGRKGVVVGDRVALVGDTTGEPDGAPTQPMSANRPANGPARRRARRARLTGSSRRTCR